MMDNDALLETVRKLGLTVPAADSFDTFRREWMHGVNEQFFDDNETFDVIGPMDNILDKPWVSDGWEDEDWHEEGREQSLPERDDLFDDNEQDSFEKYAWYRSYHFDPQHNWGIYIRTKGIKKLARKFFAIRRAASTKKQAVIDSRHWAYQLLLAHEHYHYFVDVASTVLEELIAILHAPQSVYVEYSRHIYWPQMFGKHGMDLPHEEAMANAFTFRALKTGLQRAVPHLKDATLSDVSRFMHRQPSGYRNFHCFTHGQDYILGNVRMVETLLYHHGGKHYGSVPHSFQQLLNPRGSHFAKYKVPIYIVNT
jgi:hypothetical protein